MNTRTRVLVLIDSLLAGGAERVAVETACALDSHRHAPHVCVTRGSGPLHSLLDDAGVPYTVLDRTRRLDRSAWRTLRSLAADADIVHAHKLGSNAWGALLARRTGIPLVAHEHNFGAGATASRTVVEGYWTGPVADRIVCVSGPVADTQRSYGLDPDRIVTIPNGVHLDAALPRDEARSELGLDDGDVVVGIVGRLRAEKAHEVLLEAVSHLVHGGHRDVRLCIVGNGPREEELREVATGLDIRRNVVWAGEHADAARLAAAFDVSVVCSRWEGMPLAALEALAAGVPLVASAVGGLVELLDGGAGRLVAPGDAVALAGALEELVSDPQAARSLGEAGRRRVADRYSFAQMVDRIEGVYRAVLAERASADVVRDVLAHGHPDLRERPRAWDDDTIDTWADVWPTPWQPSEGVAA